MDTQHSTEVSSGRRLRGSAFQTFDHYPPGSLHYWAIMDPVGLQGWEFHTEEKCFAAFEHIKSRYPKSYIQEGISLHDDATHRAGRLDSMDELEAIPFEALSRVDW